MVIHWSQFTPLQSLTGGLLIGLAAAVLVLLNGHVAGISGILGGLLRRHHTDWPWRLNFLLGLLATPLLLRAFGQLPAIHLDASWQLLVVSGLLVGFGTRLGSGCTSGHGICGLARRSPRSLIATAMFMALGIATVFVVRHLLGEA